MSRPRITVGEGVAVITGGGRGIGRATALALARRGTTVVCVDLDERAAQKVAAECTEMGGTGEAAVVDVADRQAMTGLAATVERGVGPVAVLINNAGVGMSGPFIDMSAADWAWIRSINLDGAVNGCAAFGPAMLERRRGHVVNMSSGLGYLPTPNEPAYVATKAAVLALSLSLRADWHRHGVGVSAICPGVIATSIVEHTRFVGDDAATRRQRVARLFRRGHDPELVAGAVIGAIEHNRAVVAVGAEAKLGWYLHRLAPVGVQQALTRLGAARR